MNGDRAKCPNMEANGRRTQGNSEASLMPCYEAAIDESGWEDTKESGTGVRQRTTGIQTRKKDNSRWTICINATGREGLGGEEIIAQGFVDIDKAFDSSRVR